MSKLRALAAVLLFLATFLTGACQKRRSGALAPLEAPSWRLELAVEGFAPASVAVPLGATAARPIVVALHGDADRPEWQCGSWRGIVGSRAFVLCPRGKLRPDAAPADPRYMLGTVEETERELRAALKALKARFGAYIDRGPALIAGFSQGADAAAQLARQEPAFFARAVLIGRGAAAWSPSLAYIFGKNGGKRVLFVCGSDECRAEAEAKAVFTRRAGADALVSRPIGAGPWFDAALVDGIRRDFGWLVEGDRRWVKEK